MNFHVVRAALLIAALLLIIDTARAQVLHYPGLDVYGWGWSGASDDDFLNSSNWYYGPGTVAPAVVPIGIGPYAAANPDGTLNYWLIPTNKSPVLSQSFSTPGITIASYDQTNSLTISNGATYSITDGRQAVVGCSWAAEYQLGLTWGEPDIASKVGNYPLSGPLVPASLNLTGGSTIVCSGGLYVGYDSSGILSLSGGSSVVGSVFVGYESGAIGTVNISDAATISSISAAPVAGSMATINIAPGASLVTQFAPSAGTVVLNNQGALEASGTLSGTINNAGTVNVTSGTLALDGGGSGTGGFATSAGAQVNFTGGTYTANAGTAFSGAGYTQLSGATLTVNGSVSATYFQQSGGILNGTGTLTISNEFDWTGGSIIGSGLTTTIASGAVLNLSGTSGYEFLGSGTGTEPTLINNGTTTLSGNGPGLGMYDGGSVGSVGALFINNGTFNATDNASIVRGIDGSHNGQQTSFVNSAGAIFNKSGAGTTTNVTVAFTNAGTINVNSGTLAVNNGGSGSGSFAMGSGAVLQFGGSTYIANSGTAFTGAGATQLIGGSLTINGAVSASNFQQSNGTLNGTGTLTISNEFDWTGGSIIGSGLTTTIASGAVLNLSGTSGYEFLGSGTGTEPTLINNGTTTLSGNGPGLGMYDGGSVGSVGALFINNGTFNATDNASIVRGIDGSHNGQQTSFVNSAGAIFNKSGAGTTTNVTVAFTNAGTINVNSGTLAVNNGGSGSGSFAMGSGAVLQFGGSTYIANSGTAFTGAGATQLIGGSLTINGAVSASNFQQSNGTLNGTGTLTISNEFDWTGGSIIGSGLTTTIASGAVLNLSGTSGYEFLGSGTGTEPTLINNGTTTLSGNGPGLGMYDGGSVGSVGALFINNGTFNATDNASIVRGIDGSHNGQQTSFVNSAGAIFNKSGAGTTTNVTVAFTNAGTVDVNSGTLAVNNGFTQTATGSVRLFIGGNQEGSTYSHLGGQQLLILAGEIQLVLEPDLFGFLPTIGETFDLIDSPDGISLSDGVTFTNFVTQTGASYLTGLPLAAYNSGIGSDPDQLDRIGSDLFTYSLVNNGTELEATYVGASAPEPATSALLFVAAGSFLVLRRSRTKP